jgi:hypothetical protein
MQAKNSDKRIYGVFFPIVDCTIFEILKKVTDYYLLNPNEMHLFDVTYFIVYIVLSVTYTILRETNCKGTI